MDQISSTTLPSIGDKNRMKKTTTGKGKPKKGLHIMIVMPAKGMPKKLNKGALKKSA